MSACQICLLPLPPRQAAPHTHCPQHLFGTDRIPSLLFSADLGLSISAEMAGKMSISGLLEKLSLRFSPDKSVLEPALKWGQYILKPPPPRLTTLSANEHLTMRLAELCGIEIPPLGLISMSDGVLAFIIRRSDREPNGTKLSTEDFCQLAELPPDQKYEGSAELCAKLVRQHATNPEAELAKLFRQFLFSWWVGNGDLHLKNLSLLTRADGSRVLSPAYDLLCTKLIIPDDNFALQMQGKRKEFRRKNWITFADHCKLPKVIADEMLDAQISRQQVALSLIHASYLPENQKFEYEKILGENTKVLSKR